MIPHVETRGYFRSSRWDSFAFCWERGPNGSLRTGMVCPRDRSFPRGSIGLVGIKMAKCFFRVRDKLARSSGKKKGWDIRVTGAGKLYETALPAPFCFLFRNAAS